MSDVPFEYRLENRIREFLDTENRVSKFFCNEDGMEKLVVEEGGCESLTLEAVRARLSELDEEIRKKAQRAMDLYRDDPDLQAALNDQMAFRDATENCTKDPEANQRKYQLYNAHILTALGQIPGFKESVEELMETRSKLRSLFQKKIRRAKKKPR